MHARPQVRDILIAKKMRRVTMSSRRFRAISYSRALKPQPNLAQNLLAELPDPECPPMLVPRDVAYERLIALARDARHNDVRVNPASDLEGMCAVAVSKFNRHPMSWLLRWTGRKERKPWWDRPLLVGVSLLVTFLLNGSDGVRAS
jgi:hypothetical protein